MGLADALAGSLLLAALSTGGDFVWATWITSSRAVFGFIHGALLFLAVGLFLGGVAGRPVPGAMAGACIGALAAGLYYVLSPVLGFSAMVVVWMLVWIALAAIYGRLNAQRLDTGPRRSRYGLSASTGTTTARDAPHGQAAWARLARRPLVRAICRSS